MATYLLGLANLVILAITTIVYFAWLQRRPKSQSVEAQRSGPHPPIEVIYPGLEEGNAAVKVDIVAVHGLGSNADWSWTWRDKTSPESSVNWLKDPDMLPAAVPDARILIYNYNSRWHFNAPRTRLQLCGEDLARSLHTFRDGVHDRPVVFVGHSLGGLVIQHALLFADREDDIRYLIRYTAGFIALGSPFRGTKMHGLANLAARLMFLAGSHRGVLENLGFDNQLLGDKLQELCRLQKSTSMPTCCFFEAFDTDYGRRFGIPGLLRGMVVPEESACVPGWDRVQLQCDHIKLNKFCGPHDRSFLSVARQISIMCNTPKERPEPRADGVNSHWIVPFERNAGFVGREQILRRLLGRIAPDLNKDACQRTSIEGLGGIGKTQLALEAAFRLRDTNPVCSVFWVPAMDATIFENTYREIGQILGVVGIDGDGVNMKMLVKDVLSRDDSRQWLMIIDNADDPELIFGSTGLSNYLPSSMNGSILFTTRTHGVTVRLGINPEGTIQTAKMQREEAVEILRRSLTSKQMQETRSTDALLNFLDDLPLAIKQASAFMWKTGMSVQRYLEHCQSSDATLIDLLSRDFEDGGRYGGTKNPVATTWHISFEHMSRDYAIARDYLWFMCFLAERDIPISLLPPLANELEADDAIGALAGYGFITKREDSMSLDMHRLVRLAMRNWLGMERLSQKIYFLVVYWVEAAFPFPRYENREIWLRYMAHARSLLESEEKICDGTAKLRLISKVAHGHIYLGHYKEAAEMHQQALELRKSGLGRDHPETVANMHNLTQALIGQGQFAEAEKLQRQTVELSEAVSGEEHPTTLTAMGCLARTLHGQRKYKEAEEMERHTLELMRQGLGKEHPNTLVTMSHLAITLTDQGKGKEAESILRQGLELKEGVLSKEHSDTLTSMNNLGEALRVQSRYAEAEEMHRQTLKLTKRYFGGEHPFVATSMGNLAVALKYQGKYEEAEKMNKQALELRVASLGEGHPHTIANRNNLALVLERQGRFEEAEMMLRETIDQQLAIGREHPQTLESMNILALVLERQDKYAGVEELFERTSDNG